MIAFATSAIREASNTDAVVATVLDQTGVELVVLTGDDEAMLTFLAVRRWFGWSSGRLAVFDIGGGSLEIAAGDDERPDVSQSLELGAGRLTRNWLPDDVPTSGQVKALRKHIRAEIARDAGPLLRAGVGDHTVATSKTFRSLARVCGAAPSEDGPFVRRMLARDDLEKWLPKITAMTSRRTLRPARCLRRRGRTRWSPVAWSPRPSMDLFKIEALEICPWALREGVILEKLDAL